jgi:SAM-dependent methyltransferase
MILSTPLPPPELVELVAGHRDVELFGISRWHAADALAGYLADAGVDIKTRRSILDFGCGCGRVLAGLENMLGPDAKLYGCEINQALTDFCRQNIKHAEVIKTGFMPPLPYGDEAFDLVYALSVYTHMTLPALLQWTGEIARILQPGGIAVITMHGSYYHADLTKVSKAGSKLLAERGYYVHLHGTEDDTWQGSNNYATFASPDFVRRLFAGFEPVACFPGSSHGPTHFQAYQDILIFRRN